MPTVFSIFCYAPGTMPGTPWPAKPPLAPTVPRASAVHKKAQSREKCSRGPCIILLQSQCRRFLISNLGRFKWVTRRMQWVFGARARAVASRLVTPSISHSLSVLSFETARQSGPRHWMVRSRLHPRSQISLETGPTESLSGHCFCCVFDKRGHDMGLGFLLHLLICSLLSSFVRRVGSDSFEEDLLYACR